MTGKLAIFRFDAGPSIGLGHAVRCGALADVLAAAGWRIGLALGPEGLAAAPRLSESGYDIETLDGADETRALINRWPGGCDLLVVDHYGRSAAFEREARPWARLVLAFDDSPNRQHDCDLLLDPAARPEERTYEPLSARGTRLLLGPQYALLRRSFIERREASLARHRTAGKVRRMLVGLGATDPADLTSRVIESVATAVPGAAIDILLGKAAPHLDRVRSRIAGRPGMRLLLDPPDVADIMAAADLAVGAAGSTSFERAYLGLPGVSLVVASNQESIAGLLQERGAARVIDGRSGDPAPEIGRALRELAGDDARRRRMSEAGASIADGQGAERVRVAVEAAIIARHPEP